MATSYPQFIPVPGPPGPPGKVGFDGQLGSPGIIGNNGILGAPGNEVPRGVCGPGAADAEGRNPRAPGGSHRRRHRVGDGAAEWCDTAIGIVGGVARELRVHRLRALHRDLSRRGHDRGSRRRARGPRRVGPGN